MSNGRRWDRATIMLMSLALLASCGGDSSTSPPAAPTITITTPASTLAAFGATLQLSATVQNSTAATTWASSLPGVVSVSATGVATAVSAGSAVITASVTGASATVTITVLQAVTAVVMTASTATIATGVGGTTQLAASARDANGNPVAGAVLTWSSQDPALATVSPTGLVTAVVREGLASISAGVGAISASASVTITDPPGPFVIEAGQDFVHTAPGRTGTVRVTAFDQESGVATPVTASGSCLSNVAVGAGQVTFTFLGSASTQCNLQLAAQGVTKSVAVIGYDPSLLNLGGGLSMRYTNEFSFVWNNDPAASNDWNGGGARVTAWRPVVPASAGSGWYPVGDHFDTRAGSGTYSLLISSPGGTGDVPMVLLRNDSGQNLAAPTGYTLIWNSFETTCALCGPNRPAIAWVWKPTCPAGFLALGSVATASASAPSTEAIRCVAAARTMPANIGRAVFTDAGSGSDRDLAIYTVGDETSLQSRTDGQIPMGARAMVACPSYTASFPSCDAATFNLLLITPQVMESGGVQRVAALTDWAAMPEIRNSARRVRLPFTLIKSQDPERNGGIRTRTRDNAQLTPFYYVETVLTTTQQRAFNNRCLTTPSNLTYTTTQSQFTEKSNAFSQEYGIKVGIEGSVGFLGTGTKVSAEVSATFNWTTTTSTGFGSETSTSLTVTAPPRYYLAIVGTKTEFYVFDEFNNLVGVSQSIVSEGTALQGLQYTGPNWKNSPSCGV